jgi:hypothetical protein
MRVMSVIRIRLFGKAPPPDKAENAFAQTLGHLQAAYGQVDPIKAFQLTHQVDFFAAR